MQEKKQADFAGLSVALTGSTGVLGGELCRALLNSRASLILLDRNPQKQEKRRAELQDLFPAARITCLTLDLADPVSVRAAAKNLAALAPDILVHNAGAYCLPRTRGKYGCDPVFETDTLGPFLLTKELLAARGETGMPRVLVVGSIASALARPDGKDPDYRTRRMGMKVYGNAKRRLTAAMLALGEREGFSVSLAHPGITATDIIAGYPRLLRAIARPAMKILFHSPQKAAASLLAALQNPPPADRQTGPRILGIWGRPAVRPHKIGREEQTEALALLEGIVMNNE